MKKLLLIACLASAHFSVYSQSEASAENKQLAREIVISQEVSAKLPNFFRQMQATTSKQMDESLKRDYPNLTAAQLSRVSQLYGAALAQEMEVWMKEALPKIQDATVDLYIRRFSLQELQQIKNFYTSEMGKKLFNVTIEEIPELMAPMMQDAGRFGGAMGKRIVEINKQLEGEGILLQKK